MRIRRRKNTSKADRKKQRRGQKLHETGLKASTLQKYREAVHQALEQWDFCAIKYENVVAFDLELGDFLEHSYEEGESVSFAGNLICGLQVFLPFLRRHLPYSWHLFSLWRRNERSWQATPMGDELLWALVGKTLECQWLAMGTLLMLGYFGLLRTGELVNLRVGDLRVSSSEVIVYIAAPKSSSRRGQGEHVVIRERAVVHFVSTLLQLETDRKAAVWKGSPQKFRDDFSRMIGFFRLESAGYRPYSLRRGGATRLYRLQTPMELILIQGRWKNSSSARTYIADGMTELARLNFKPRTLSLMKRYHAVIGFSP